MNFKTAFIFWFVMVVIAIANGFVGEKVVSRYLGDYGSHLYKTIFIIVVIFIGARIFVSSYAPEPVFSSALSAGLLWFFCSLTFEFIFGHFVFGFPWEKLVADYKIWQGRLWSLVLASEIIAPLINAWLLKR